MKDLTKGDETKQLIGFALPMLLGNIFQQFYNMVDSFVVGRFLGTTALAAVGTSFPIIFFMLSLIMGVAMGSTVLISQFFGAKDPGNLRKVISTSYIFLLIAGTIMSAVGVLSTSFILKALAVPADIMPEASAYLRIIFAGMLATFGYNGVAAMLRGLGDSKTPLYLLIASTLMNVVLDLVFVVVFKWGVAGAAWATTASGASGRARGRETCAVQPAPGSGASSQMVPPCSSTIWRERARPSPSPPRWRVGPEVEAVEVQEEFRSNEGDTSANASKYGNNYPS